MIPPERSSLDRGGDTRAKSAGKRRRKTQVLGWTLIWSGLFIFGYLGWQLFGTDVVNARVQAEAAANLDEHLDQVREEQPEIEEVEDEGGVVVEHFSEALPAEDQGFALISFPSLGVEAVVFEGVTGDTLSKGPGHMPGTPLPGQPGNSVISGHRTTHGRPFYDLDRLSAGDRIELETGIGTHVYEVRESFIVKPTDVWVTEHIPGGWLTLTTCHPRFSARERLIVTAEMVEGPNVDYVRMLEERLEGLA